MIFHDSWAEIGMERLVRDCEREMWFVPQPYDKQFLETNWRSKRAAVAEIVAKVGFTYQIAKKDDGAKPSSTPTITTFSSSSSKKLLKKLNKNNFLQKKKNKLNRPPQ
ncbi:hypothetical protein GGI43DRAFT_380427 [Trichoderma evansii]